MNQYNLTYPVEGKIYYSSSSKEAAKKAFYDLVKYNKYNQTRIILENNNTKKKYNYIGITNNKLQEYNKLLQSKNPIQIGGSDEVSDKEFYSRLSELSENMNLSITELSKILKTKYDPEEEKNNKIFVLIEEGIDKLDKINNNISNMNKEITDIKAKIVGTKSITENSDELDIQGKKGGFCTIM